MKPKVFLFAPGAGGGIHSTFMTKIAKGVEACGLPVVRFEFPPNATRKQDLALDTWRRLVKEHGGGSKVAIGGKSFGGRMASLVADELRVNSLICLGYPFHPPGQPQKLRTEHLAGLKTRTLIIQGERDPFGTPEDVARYELSPSIHILWMPKGDHSLGAGNLSQAAGIMCTFLMEAA